MNSCQELEMIETYLFSKINKIHFLLCFLLFPRAQLDLNISKSILLELNINV